MTKINDRKTNQGFQKRLKKLHAQIQIQSTEKALLDVADLIRQSRRKRDKQIRKAIK